MKKLGKIKLVQLNKEELDQRRMNALKGGCACVTNCSSCPCSCTIGFLSSQDSSVDSGNSFMDDGGLREY